MQPPLPPPPDSLPSVTQGAPASVAQLNINHPKSGPPSCKGPLLQGPPPPTGPTSCRAPTSYRAPLLQGPPPTRAPLLQGLPPAGPPTSCRAPHLWSAQGDPWARRGQVGPAGVSQHGGGGGKASPALCQGRGTHWAWRGPSYLRVPDEARLIRFPFRAARARGDYSPGAVCVPREVTDSWGSLTEEQVPWATPTLLTRASFKATFKPGPVSSATPSPRTCSPRMLSPREGAPRTAATTR